MKGNTPILFFLVMANWSALLNTSGRLPPRSRKTYCQNHNPTNNPKHCNVVWFDTKMTLHIHPTQPPTETLVSALEQYRAIMSSVMSSKTTITYQTKPKLQNPTYQTRPTKPNLPNPTYQTQPTKPNLPNQTYQTKPTKPNLPNQTYQTKPTKPYLPNHTYQTKPTTPKLPNLFIVIL